MQPGQYKHKQPSFPLLTADCCPEMAISQSKRERKCLQSDYQSAENQHAGNFIEQSQERWFKKYKWCKYFDEWDDKWKLTGGRKISAGAAACRCLM